MIADDRITIRFFGLPSFAMKISEPELDSPIPRVAFSSKLAS